MNFILVVYLVSLFAQLCSFSKLRISCYNYAAAYNLMWGNSVGSSCIYMFVVLHQCDIDPQSHTTAHMFSKCLNHSAYMGDQGHMHACMQRSSLHFYTLSVARLVYAHVIWYKVNI